MSVLFNEIIFGPVRSRRLGVSLGVNLLPSFSKICNFDCIYCECGWNDDNRGCEGFNLPEDVHNALKQRLIQMQEDGALPDVITFAGNGEPTLNPHFEQIIDDTITLRNTYAPNAKVSVLSNATMLHKEGVIRALKRVDNNILKLDSAINSTALLMNKPLLASYSVDHVREQMKRFEGELIVQTMFLRGSIDGSQIDNTTPEEVSAWLLAIKDIAPKQVMIYSIDRDTPCHTIFKIEREELLAIGEEVNKLGIDCSIA